jgi:energy-converting hydrogenase Eha subunit B
VAVVVDLLAAAATSVGAVSTAEVSVVVSAAVALVLVVFVAAVWLSNPLEADPGAAVVALALAIPVLAAFAQPRICMEALILPVEVSAGQPVHSDTTTEATARLLLGHPNSAEGETNR